MVATDWPLFSTMAGDRTEWISGNTLGAGQLRIPPSTKMTKTDTLIKAPHKGILETLGGGSDRPTPLQPRAVKKCRKNSKPDDLELCTKIQGCSNNFSRDLHTPPAHKPYGEETKNPQNTTTSKLFNSKMHPNKSVMYWDTLLFQILQNEAESMP